MNRARRWFDTAPARDSISAAIDALEEELRSGAYSVRPGLRLRYAINALRLAMVALEDYAIDDLASRGAGTPVVDLDLVERLAGSLLGNERETLPPVADSVNPFVALLSEAQLARGAKLPRLAIPVEHRHIERLRLLGFGLQSRGDDRWILTREQDPTRQGHRYTTISNEEDSLNFSGTNVCVATFEEDHDEPETERWFATFDDAVAHAEREAERCEGPFRIERSLSGPHVLGDERDGSTWESLSNLSDEDCPPEIATLDECETVIDAHASLALTEESLRGHYRIVHIASGEIVATYTIDGVDDKASTP